VADAQRWEITGVQALGVDLVEVTISHDVKVNGVSVNENARLAWPRDALPTVGETVLVTINASEVPDRGQ
jgi:hypothetical protein